MPLPIPVVFSGSIPFSLHHHSVNPYDPKQTVKSLIVNSDYLPPTPGYILSTIDTAPRGPIANIC